MNTSIQAFAALPLPAGRQMAVEQAQAYKTLYMTAYVGAFLYGLQKSELEQNGVEAARDLVLKLTRDFGLSMTAAAQVLHVTRATLYPWLKLERAPQTAQMKRVNQVKRALAVLETEIASGHKPLEMLARLPDGQSVFSLLCSSEIDFDRLQSAARCLSEQMVVRVVDITDEELEADPVASPELTDLFRDIAKWKNAKR